METNPFEQIVEDHDLLCPRCGVPPLLKKVRNMWVVQCLSCGRKTTDVARFLAEADGWVKTGQEVVAPAPAAWGPPMAQPDAEGWWAFKGEFCISALTSAVDVETIHLFEADDLDEETLGLYNGTFRKLLVSPWEVTP
jgi:hypothetical protein